MTSLRQPSSAAARVSATTAATRCPGKRTTSSKSSVSAGSSFGSSCRPVEYVPEMAGSARPCLASTGATRSRPRVPSGLCPPTRAPLLTSNVSYEGSHASRLPPLAPPRHVPPSSGAYPPPAFRILRILPRRQDPSPQGAAARDRCCRQPSRTILPLESRLNSKPHRRQAPTVLPWSRTDPNARTVTLRSSSPSATRITSSAIDSTCPRLLVYLPYGWSPAGLGSRCSAGACRLSLKCRLLCTNRLLCRTRYLRGR